jgi:thymidylate synthase
MMRVVEGTTVDELFTRAIGLILEEGKPCAPRGIATREIYPVTLSLRNPRARVLRVGGRTINPAFAVAETLWILSGTDEPWIFDFNARLRNYADDGRLAGAYGPRLRAFGSRIDQLAGARSKLVEDPDTRQAVIQILDPATVRPGHRDVPCTLSYRFLLRDKRLTAFCTMRSQDAWLGLPYDVFVGTVIQELMASWVGAEVGEYHHTVDSLHLYESDLSAARAIVTSSAAPREMQPLSCPWHELDRVVSDAIGNRLPPDHSFAPLMLAMESYRQWKSGRRDITTTMVSMVGGPLQDALERWYRSIAERGTASAERCGRSNDDSV